MRDIPNDAPQERTGRVGCTKLQPSEAECNYSGTGKRGNNEFKLRSPLAFPGGTAATWDQGEVNPDREERLIPRRNSANTTYLGPSN